MVSLLPIVKLVFSRLLHGATTFPTFSSLKNVLLCAVALDSAVVGLGVTSGMYRWKPMDNARALGWSGAYLMVRAVLEEIVFRAILLPHPKADGPKAMRLPGFWISAAFPIALFVASHMWTTQRKPNQVLNDTRFLSTLLVCGVASTWAYWVSSGGLWAAITMHFLVVFPWMVLLGGYRKTHTPTPLQDRAGMAPRASGGITTGPDAKYD